MSAELESEFEQELDCLIRFYSVKSESAPRDYALSQYLEACMLRFQFTDLQISTPQSGATR